MRFTWSISSKRQYAVRGSVRFIMMGLMSLTECIRYSLQQDDNTGCPNMFHIQYGGRPKVLYWMQCVIKVSIKTLKSLNMTNSCYGDREDIFVTHLILSRIQEHQSIAFLSYCFVVVSRRWRRHHILLFVSYGSRKARFLFPLLCSLWCV